MQLQKKLKAIQATGTQVVGISPDKPAILKRFAEKASIQFTLLSDEGSKTIKAFGIEQSAKLPHPGTIIVDREGVIRAKMFQQGYVRRHSADELIRAAKSVD